jgi:hypothetical protein
MTVKRSAPRRSGCSSVLEHTPSDTKYLVIVEQVRRISVKRVRDRQHRDVVRGRVSVKLEELRGKDVKGREVATSGGRSERGRGAPFARHPTRPCPAPAVDPSDRRHPLSTPQTAPAGGNDGPLLQWTRAAYARQSGQSLQARRQRL